MIKYTVVFVVGLVVGVIGFDRLTGPTVKENVAFSMYKKDPIGTKINDLKIRFKKTNK